MDDFFDNQIPWDETTAPDADVVASAREALAERKRREAERNKTRILTEAVHGRGTA